MKKQMKIPPQRPLIATLIGAALGFALAGPALAASDRAESATSSLAASQDKDLRASKLIGMHVKNPQGETLGKIDDLVIDVNNDRVSYAILASGGLMGMGSKLFAYPISLFRPGNDKNELALNVDKEKLKQAPGFEHKNWPDWGSQDRYRSEVDRYFGPTVTAKALPNERLLRASTLIGKNIDDRQGQKAGEVKDLVVNLESAKLHYAVLDLNKNWGAGDKLLPVSVHALTFPSERGKNLTFNLARNQVDLARMGIDEKHWKDMDLNDPAFKRQMESQMRTATSSMGAGAAGRPGSEAEKTPPGQ